MMLLRGRTIFSYATIRHHSTSAAKILNKIPYKYRARAIKQAQEALTDYLHSVRTIPYTFAENISKYSVVSLSSVMSKVQFTTSDFSKSLHKFLRYHPVNEFELFFESIGIDVDELDGVLPVRKFFLSDEINVFNAACVLYCLGVPWNKIGMMYKQEKTIFGKDPCELKEIWSNFISYGFTSSSLIGICLVFPNLLNGDEALFKGLKRVIIDFDLISDVDGNVDSWIDMCRKIRLFYDLDCRKLDVFKMIGGSKNILVEYSEDFLAEKIDYFCGFDVTKEEVVSLLFSDLEILKYDLKSPAFCVVGLLKRLGMNEKEFSSLTEKYPYVFGRNRLANLPYVMRALNLNQWFFNKLKNGGHRLLKSYPCVNFEEDSDKDYAESLVQVKSSRMSIHTLSKLDFLHGIGYGENVLTMKVLKHVHGTSSQLKERFDCLNHNGINISKLCKMISLAPKILNQQPEILEKKLRFLCKDIGSSLDYLDVFPAYLCFDLDKRIKPRYKFHMWLLETGLCEREYSLASIVATSEIMFMARIHRINPAAPKKYLESFLNQNYDPFQET
ncbi:Mitochodrial transcription termination factor-related protein [Artemisia annua]|uniref:Mitochodrial transcription termination factor-related protein n=1 Tax=Artemisia annua TaxID=35608 RepID=A0A2U1KGZ5_ARTAN|nr:Mitochodrial transcription termination factor-related protein [Artemisia annua]